MKHSFTDELVGFPLFAGIDTATLETLGSHAQALSCKSGLLLIDPDKPVQSLYIVLRGAFKVIMAMRSERPIVLAFLGRGTLLGELGMLQLEQGRSAAVIALDQSDVLLIRRQLFQQCLERSARLRHNLSIVLGQRLRRSNEQLWIREEPDLLRRIAWTLNNLAADYGELQRDGSIRIPFRFVQQDLADLIGSGRPRLNQQLRILYHNGLIDYQQHYVIYDPPRLWGIAEGVEVLPSQVGQKLSPAEQTGSQGL